MRHVWNKIIAASILLALTTPLLVGILSSSHTHAAHDGIVPCPFMAHAETICPMTAYDHIAKLRSIFETVLPSINTLVSAISIVLIPWFKSVTLVLLLSVYAYTLERWRQQVLVRFAQRPFQDLFAQGILHPKIFT
jgi:hypothetical protein